MDKNTNVSRTLNRICRKRPQYLYVQSIILETFAIQVSRIVQVNCSEDRNETKRNSDKADYFRVPKFSHSSVLRINKEQDNRSTKQGFYQFFGAVMKRNILNYKLFRK
jgi:hypothetical protein